MEEEINLVHYVKILFKRKWIIFGITIIFIFLSIFSILFQKSNYNGNVVLESGRMYVFQKGVPSLFEPENALQIQKRIEQRGYDNLIKEDVDLSKILKVETSLADDRSNILEINVTGTNEDDVLKYLQALSSVIISENNKVFVVNKNYFQNEIKQEKEKISALERSSNLSDLQSLYNEHLLRLNDLAISLNSIKEARIIREPIINIFNVLKIIKLITGLVLGLFFGIIAAFIVDFWQKNKKEILEK